MPLHALLLMPRYPRARPCGSTDSSSSDSSRITGTGMRASVMAHLPALVMSKQINKVLHAITKLGLTARDILRKKGTTLETLGLDEAKLTDKERVRIDEEVFEHMENRDDYDDY